jgi:hypothetical protein
VKTAANFITIEFPGAIETYAKGINDDGQIVGQFYGQASPAGF